MKKQLLLLILIISFTAVSATAQFTTADGIGVYFDQADPGSNSVDTSGPFELVTAYLLLTNPSSSHFYDGEYRAVSGWECMVTIGGDPVAEVWELAGQQPLNIKTAPEFVVGVGEEALALPISANDAVLLATYTCYITDMASEAAYRVDPLPDSSFDPLAPGYAAAHDSGVLIPLTQTIPATINTTLANSPTDGSVVPVTSTRIDISWTDNSDDESGFVIYRTYHDEGIGWEITELDTFTVAADVVSYSDTDCLPNSEYFYRVFSQKTVGTEEFNSAEFTGGTATALEGPAAPSNLVIAAQSSTELLLTWTDNSDNEDLFRISRHTQPTGIFVDIATVGADVTTYLDSGLEPGETYYYRVIASNAIGDSDYIQGNGTTFSPPAHPTNLNLAPVSNSQIDLDWTDNSDDENGFRIYRGVSAGDMPLLAEVTFDVVAYSDTGLSPHAEYFYKVASFNEYGESESGTVSASTLNSDPTIDLSGLSAVFDEDSSTVVDFAVYINDNDGDTLILTATDSTNIFAAIDGLSVTFTATENWNGSEELTFTVNDQQGRAVASDVTTVVVNPVNDAPTIDLTPLTVSFTQGTTLDVDFTEYVEDVDLDDLTLTASDSDSITTEITGLVVTFGTASNEFVGFENITFTIFDGEFENQATTTVTVNALGDIPAPPSSLALTVIGTDAISLQWVDNSINEDGFRIYRSLEEGNFSLLAEVSTNETSYTDNGLTQNTTYYYYVTAYNSYGENDPQEAQSATTEAELPVAPVVTATTSSSSEILLEWTDSLYEDGYRVYRSEVAEEPGILVADLPADQLEFLDDVTAIPERTPNTQYWYTVEAYNPAGEAQSEQVSAMTLDVIPECPDNLILEVLSDTEIAMTWTDNSNNELKFAIWRSQTEGDCGVLVAEVPVDVTFWQDSGLELGTDYWYCVYAYNEIGQCLTPATGGATTLNPVPTITSIEDIPGDEGGFVTVNFNRSVLDTGDGIDENYSIEIFTDESWTEASSEPAVGDDIYSVIVMLPETGTISEPAIFQFRVLANMDEGSYLSEEMSGYAIDNLAPTVDLLTAVPTQEGVVLEWSAAIIPDLQHFVVTRREFGGEMVEIGTSMTVSFVDADPDAIAGEYYYYSVYGIDIHENVGDPADEVQVSFPQPTLLSSFSTEATGAGVEITWELSDIDPDVSFIVKRSVAEAGTYTVIDMPVIQLSELVFTVDDPSAQPGDSYTYRVDFEIDNGSWLLFETSAVQMPELSYALYQNSPNPFNPLTTISYDLNKASTVRLTIYDIAGRAVRHLIDSPGESAGRHHVKWFGRDDSGQQVTSGVYFYVIQAGEFKQSKRMLLLK